MTVLETLERLISTKRYEHSVRVADTVRLLAVHYGADEQGAYTAGLIHDCAKEMTPDSDLCSFSADETLFYEQFPAIWHGVVLPTVVPVCFSDVSTDSIDAARWHSTGKANMTLLAKILFVADYIEPGRSFENRELLYKLAFESLDGCVAEIAVSKLTQLIMKKVSIHPLLLDCYNSYI